MQYEMFFGAHHWFIIFFLFLLAHGPVFYAWAVLPLVLYVCERYMRVFRGNRYANTTLPYLHESASMPTHASILLFVASPQVVHREQGGVDPSRHGHPVPTGHQGTVPIQGPSKTSWL
jgi:hypothetical protein